jgi:hypothetical protein
VAVKRKPAQLALEGIGEPVPKTAARIRRGVETQLRAQRAAGQLEHVDAGLIAVARTLADAMDAEHTALEGNRFTVGSLAGRLVPVLLELRGERVDVGFDAELATLVAALRDTPRPDPT